MKIIFFVLIFLPKLAFSEVTFSDFKKYYCSKNYCSIYKNYPSPNTSANSSVGSSGYGNSSWGTGSGQSSTVYGYSGLEIGTTEDQLYEIYINLIKKCSKENDQESCNYLSLIEESSYLIKNDR